MSEPIFGPFVRPKSVAFGSIAVPPVLDSHFLSGNVASPFFVGVTVGHSSGTNNKSFALDGPNEVFVVAIGYDWTQAGGPVSVSSFTESSNTLTFTKRFGYQVNVQTPGSPPTSAGGLGVELWTAPCITQFNQAQAAITYTLTMSGNVSDNCEATCFALKNIKRTHIAENNYFDPSLPVEADQEGVGAAAPTALPQPVRWVTGRAGDAVLAFTYSTSGTHPSFTTPSGWTNIVNSFAGAIRFLGYSIDMLGVPKKGTPESYVNGSSTTQAGYITVADAISY